MKRLYTLQECFEQAGSKFPFTVMWHWYWLYPVELTFVENKTTDGEILWRVKDSSWDTRCNGDFVSWRYKTAHLLFAEESKYEYKICNFNIDFDSIIK